MRTLEGHQGRVRGLAYLPDGSALASAGDDGTVRLWDPADGRLARVLEGSTVARGYYGHAVFGVAASPDGFRLAAAGGDRRIRLWDLAGGGDPEVLAGHSGVVTSLAFLDDVRLLSGGGNGRGQVALWDLTTLEPRFAAYDSGGIWSVAADPASGLVAIGTAGTRNYVIQDGRQSYFGDTPGLFFWDPGSGGPPEPRPDVARVRSLAYSPDGRWLAASQADRVAVWEVDSESSGPRTWNHGGTVLGLAFGPGGSTLASASREGTVRVRDVETGEELACYDWEIGAIDCVAFAPDGMTVAAGGRGGIVIWDAGWS